MHFAFYKIRIFIKTLNGGNMNREIYSNLGNSAFSVATLLYTRLRRVSGRVVDVVYLAENADYAKYVITLALETKDEDLIKHAESLKKILGLEIEKQKFKSPVQMLEESAEKLQASYEATEEEVYKAQVSHHYIGSLR